MATTRKAVAKPIMAYAMSAQELRDVSGMIDRLQSVADHSDDLYISSGSVTVRHGEGFILGVINIGDDGDEVVFTADLV